MVSGCVISKAKQMLNEKKYSVMGLLELSSEDSGEIDSFIMQTVEEQEE